VGVDVGDGAAHGLGVVGDAREVDEGLERVSCLCRHVLIVPPTREGESIPVDGTD
jgi:hypothetical protein